MHLSRFIRKFIFKIKYKNPKDIETVYDALLQCEFNRKAAVEVGDWAIAKYWQDEYEKYYRIREILLVYGGK